MNKIVVIILLKHKGKIKISLNTVTQSTVSTQNLFQGFDFTFSTSLEPSVAGYEVSTEVDGVWEMLPAIIQLQSSPPVLETMSTELMDFSVVDEFDEQSQGEMDKVSLLTSVMNSVDKSNSNRLTFLLLKFLSFIVIFQNPQVFLSAMQLQK